MHVTLLNVFGIIVAGAVTGVLGAILGTGGGVFLIPVLVLALGLPMHYAVATSLVSVIATSSAVASTNVERGTANMRLGMTLEIATALGAICGGLTAGWLSHRLLEGLFAAVILPTAYFMWRGRTGHGAQTSEADINRGTAVTVSDSPPANANEEEVGLLGARYLDDFDSRTVSYRVQRLWAGLGISFLAGNLSGLLGIGGGTFKVPALHLVCGVPIKAAAATSNFMIGVTAAASAFLYYGRGEIRPAISSAAVLGVLAGSALGTVLNRRVRGRLVRRLFAVLLVAVAVQMFYRALTRGG